MQAKPTAPTLTDVIDAMIATRFCDEAGLVGCSDDDIDDFELRYGLKLPETYVSFMKVAGRTRAGAAFVGDAFSLHIDDVAGLTAAYRADPQIVKHRASPLPAHQLIICSHWLSRFAIEATVDVRAADAAVTVFDVHRDNVEEAAPCVLAFLIARLTAPRALDDVQRAAFERVMQIDWHVLGVVAFDAVRERLFDDFTAAAHECAAHHADVDATELGRFSVVQQLMQVKAIPEVVQRLASARMNSRGRAWLCMAMAGFVAWEGLDRASRRALWPEGNGRNPIERLVEFLEAGGGIDVEHGFLRGLEPRADLQLPLALPGLHVFADDADDDDNSDDDDDAMALTKQLLADPSWLPLRKRWDTRWCRLVASTNDGHVIVAVANQTWIVSPSTSSAKRGVCAIDVVNADWREVVVALTRNAMARTSAPRR